MTSFENCGLAPRSAGPAPALDHGADAESRSSAGCAPASPQNTWRQAMDLAFDALELEEEARGRGDMRTADEYKRRALVLLQMVGERHGY